MIFIYAEPSYEDTTFGFASHDDAVEGRAVFDALAATYQGIHLVATAPEVTVVRPELDVRPLHEVVSRFLCGFGVEVNTEVFDAVPLAVLRPAVEHRVRSEQDAAQRWTDDGMRERSLSLVEALRAALLLRGLRTHVPGTEA